MEYDFGDDEELSGNTDVASVHNDAFRLRKLIINSSIDSGVIESLFMGVELLAFDDQDAPIYIYINSDGGSLFETLFIADFLRTVDYPIVTVATGICLSAALLILCCGKHRVCYPHTMFMIHEGKTGASEDNIQSAKNYLDAVAKYSDMYFDIMKEQCDISVAEIRKRLKDEGDWYFTAQEALEFGFIDHIIKPKYTFKNKKVWGEKCLQSLKR